MANQICEVKVKGEWIETSIEDALRLDKDQEKRCPLCIGRFKALGIGRNGERAHFEHYEAFPGCKNSHHYDGGGQRKHPNPVE